MERVDGGWFIVGGKRRMYSLGIRGVAPVRGEARINFAVTELELCALPTMSK